MRERDIFIEALELGDPSKQAALLDKYCQQDAELRGRVEQLLAEHDRQESFILDTPPTGFNGFSTGQDGARTIDRPITEGPGTAIGPYKLLQQIGEGGMGVVFMADQTEPFQRTVALKIIKPGMDTRQVIARFEAERQAVAMMDHPNIAKVLDAGTTESGRPYFVMELVKGIAITKYCDEKRLPLRARLELFVEVCQAVQHAHQKGIIHRDIKPNNVLVAEYDNRAVPKVIDFGVAKATAQRLTERTMFTEFGQVLGTMEYMSPEQSKFNQLDIDTRSDIYSLGVLLYETLTGSTPFEGKRLQAAAHDEMLRIIREEEPPKPSTRLSSIETLPSVAVNRGVEPLKLNRLVQGELDWIVMKALEKDRNRRYETASSFAADIERHLQDEPVEAGPPSAAYRFRKFAKRNKAVLATTAIVAASLVLGTVVSLWQARVARDAQALAQHNSEEAIAQRARAEANLRKAREAVDQMLTRTSQRSLAGEPHMTLVRRDLLEDALKFYQGFLDQNSTDPEVRLETARAWQRVGGIHNELGQYTQSLKEVHESIAMLEKVVDEFPSEPNYRAELAASYQSLGFVYYGAHDYGGSEVPFRKALALEEALLSDLPNQPDYRDMLSTTTHGLAYSLRYRGRPDEAERALRRSLKIRIELARDSPSHRKRLPWHYTHLANLLFETGKVGEAEAALREALAIVDQFGHGPDTFLNCTLAKLLQVSARTQEAEELYRSALAIAQKRVADFPDVPGVHRGLAIVEIGLGQLLAQEGRVSEAEQLYRDALDRTEAAAANTPHAVLDQLWESYSHLSSLLEDAQRSQEAEQIHRRAVAFHEKLMTDHADVPDDRGALASRYQALGKFLRDTDRPIDAVQAYRQALGVCEKLVADFPEDWHYHWQWTHIRVQLIELLKASGQVSELENLNRRTIAIHERLGNTLSASHEALEHTFEAPDAEYRNLLIGLEHADERREADKDYQSSLTTIIEWALKVLEPVMEAEPMNSVHWAARGRLKTRLGHWDEAAADFAKATELAPKEGSYWNTLGVAHYRAGDWQAAVAALDKSMELRNGGDSFDWFFLAMAHWQLREKDKARKWYLRAVEKYDSSNEELRRFRAEAAELLGITEPHSSTEPKSPEAENPNTDNPTPTSPLNPKP